MKAQQKTVPIESNFTCSSTSSDMLTVKETRVNDAGVYECQAINPVGQVTQNFTLLVVGKTSDITHP